MITQGDKQYVTQGDFFIKADFFGVLQTVIPFYHIFPSISMCQANLLVINVDTVLKFIYNE